MKVRHLITAAALILAGIAYADDVKVVSGKDSASATNGKISLEIKTGEAVRLTDSKNAAALNISFMDKSGKAKLKADRFSVESNTPTKSVIAVYAGKPEKVMATFTMDRNSEYVLICPGRDTNGTLVEMKSEISVLPDMLAEDYLYFPDKIKNRCRVPTESYCIMNLMNGGNTISACLWIAEDSKAYLGKNSADSKTVDYNLIDSGRLKKLYVGIISASGIWHIIKEKLNNEKFTKVDWKAPFEAQWLATMKLDKGLQQSINDGNFDTWVIPERKQDASTIILELGVVMINKSIWTAWASIHGGFPYPFYTEKGDFFAKYPKAAQISYNTAYPSVIYSYKYDKSFYFNKPSASNCPVTLPCDKLAEVLPYHEIERLTAAPPPENVYIATCAITEEIFRYYKDDQEQEKKNTIIKQVDVMDKFVDVKDKRFNDYRNWAQKEIKDLKDIAAQNDKLKPLIKELTAYLELVEKNYEAAKENVKTPEESAALSAKYIELIDDTKLSPEQKEELVDKLGRDIRTMGGKRDNLIAQMRLTVKSIRYHLTEKLAGSLSPEEETIIAKLRKDCGDILWAKHGHEGK